MKLASINHIADIDFMAVRCSTYATLLIFTAALTLAFAFTTSHWLESETIPDQKFQRLGLWEACFNKLYDDRYRYDRVVSGCKWLFDDDYSFMIDFLEPSKYQV